MPNAIVDTFARHQGNLLKLILSLIVVLFFAILLTAYLVARRANPVFLDEHGKPLKQPTTQQSY